MLQVAQDVLADQLGRPVGVGARQRRVFANRQAFGVAIHRGRRTEDQRLGCALSVVPFERLGDGEQAAQVVLEIVQRDLGRFAHRLQRREMHDGIHPAEAFPGQLEGAVHCQGMTDVALHELRHLSAQRMQALQHLGRAVDEVVDAHHRVAGFLQSQPRMRGDVAGGAGEEDAGHDVRELRPEGLIHAVDIELAGTGCDGGVERSVFGVTRALDAFDVAVQIGPACKLVLAADAEDGVAAVVGR